MTMLGPMRPGEHPPDLAAVDVPVLRPTTYSNGYGLVEPDDRPPPDAEPGAITVDSIARRALADRYGVRSLSEIPATAPPPLILGRIAPEGHTLLYGDGGVGKGVLTSSWIVGLVTSGLDVLVVDYENNPAEWARRVAGLGGPDITSRVHHVSPTARGWHGRPGAFWEHADDIGSLAASYGADVIVIDSIIIGCHGHDPSDPATASAYSAAVAQLERPVLSIGHNTKMGTGAHPFGSVVWHNAARLTWSLERVSGGLLLRCRKANNYRIPPRYLVTSEWRDDVPVDVWEKPYAEALHDKVMGILEAEPMALAPLVDRVNEDLDEGEAPVKADSIRKVLQRARGRELVVLDGGKWKR